MVQRLIKVPKHGGPDGQGLPQVVFEELLVLVEDQSIPDDWVKQAMELCLGASLQQQWNDEFRPELLKRCIDIADK